MKNWPACAGRCARPAPETVTVVASDPSGRTSLTTMGARRDRHNGTPTRKTRTAPAATAYRPFATVFWWGL